MGDVYFISRSCRWALTRMGYLRCWFVLLGLVVSSLGGMLDEARICDRFDRRANSYVPMVNVETVEEVAWKCNMDMNKKKYTDTFVAECDVMEANCFKKNNYGRRMEYQRKTQTLLLQNATLWKPTALRRTIMDAGWSTKEPGTPIILMLQRISKARNSSTGMLTKGGWRDTVSANVIVFLIWFGT